MSESGSKPKRPLPLAVMAIVVMLLISGVILFKSFAPPPRDVYAYFYDLDSRQLIAAKRVDDPPFDFPPGNAVKAAVLSCGDCSDPSQRYTGWLETYTEQGKAMLADAKANASDEAAARQVVFEVEQMRLVAAVPEAGEQPKWLPMTSPSASEYMSQAQSQCTKPNQQLSYCVPEGPQSP